MIISHLDCASGKIRLEYTPNSKKSPSRILLSLFDDQSIVMTSEDAKRLVTLLQQALSPIGSE